MFAFILFLSELDCELININIVFKVILCNDALDGII